MTQPRRPGRRTARRSDVEPAAVLDALETVDEGIAALIEWGTGLPKVVEDVRAAAQALRAAAQPRGSFVLDLDAVLRDLRAEQHQSAARGGHAVVDRWLDSR